VIQQGAVRVIGLAALMAAQAPTPPPLGLAEVFKEQLCIALPGVRLTEGSPVTLVRVDSPQRAVAVVVEREVSNCEGMERAMLPGPFYAAASWRTVNWADGFWVAVAGRRATRQRDGAVTVALSAAYPGARVRSCASVEGVHFTVWAGEPLRSRRLWHQYYYLGYDVEPSCQPADYSD
jgi:hypothetical protein